MSIEQAEQLKRELTDKWVVVADQIPELRRFASLTGKVKTVNMNCRALVEFDGPEDISWYDIDPQFLTVVDEPRPKKEAAPEAKAEPKKAAAAAVPSAGGSPLDQIRAGGSAAAKPTSGSPLDQIRGSAGAAVKAPASGSPLDQIRAQAGGESAKPAAAAGGSPLDQIRAQAGGGTDDSPKQDDSPAPEQSVEEKAPAPKAESLDLPPGASPLDVIRAQGGFKG